MTLSTLSAGRRVVIENDHPDEALAQMSALEAEGFSVVVCGGPTSLPGHTCPAVDAGWCPWVEATDVVVFGLDDDDPGSWAVLAAVRRAYPDVPIVTELPTSVAQEHAGSLAGCVVIPPIDMDHLVDVVSAAAAARPPRRRRERTNSD